MNVIKYSTLALAVFASACGAVSNGGATGDPTPTPTPGGDGVTVADIQKGTITENSTVSLEALVVTAIKVGGSGVDFWAQDAGGGSQSGMYFFDQNGNTPADIAVGDEINVSGLYKEFYDLSEVVVESAEITNNGLTPAIDAVSLADLADATAVEAWESCLVEIDATDLTVIAAANNYNEFPVGDGTDSVNVDDLLYDASETVGAGSAVTYLAGVVNYAFEEWKLLPRSADDLATDIIPVVATTIVDVQTGAVAPDGGVTIENVIVTGVRGTTGFWAQDIGGGASSGMYFFAQAAGTFPTGIAVGDQVTVSGTYKEFFELSEVILSTVDITSSGNVVTINDVTLADASLEEWESCLVNVTSATAMTVGAAPNMYKEFPVTNGTVSLKVDDFIFDSSASFVNGAPVTTLRGVLNYSFNERKLLPRSAADIQ